MKKIRFAVLVCLALFSCKKDPDQQEKKIKLNGVYTEVSPSSGRSQLVFIGTDELLFKQDAGLYVDNYNYKIEGDRFWFITTGNFPSSTSLEFHVIDENSFEIADLFVTIPEAPKTFMVYRK